MTKRLLLIPAAAFLTLSLAVSAQAQAAAQKKPSRNATRQKLRALLDTAGQHKDINATFRQGTNQPYSFFALMSDGLKNAESLEVVIVISEDDTINVNVYPHLNGRYINIERTKNATGLMRKLLVMNSHNFLHWGLDDAGDIFASFNFTLESGFPSESILTVLRAVRNTDQFMGELRPFIDGKSAQ